MKYFRELWKSPIAFGLFMGSLTAFLFPPSNIGSEIMIPIVLPFTAAFLFTRRILPLLQGKSSS